jgi:hypothetical protein
MVAPECTTVQLSASARLFVRKTILQPPVLLLIIGAKLI